MSKWLKNNPVWFVSLILIFIISIYWSFVATDRYVSAANVVLETPQVSTSGTALNFQSILTGAGSGSNDMLILRDFLLSVDMLKKVNEKFGFIKHYSNRDIDIVSRLWDEDVPLEIVHRYYKKVINIELDEYAQVLRLSVTSYDPLYSNKVLAYLLDEGEKQMNEMGKRLAEEQVKFLEKQVSQLEKNLELSRSNLLQYQNENGLVSPTETVESISQVVSALEAQLANLRARKSALQSYQSERSPELIKVESEITALNQQINLERARMAQQGGDALNTVSSEYQTLEMRMLFAKESYSAALSALESTRIEAARKLKQLSILQSPTIPEYAAEPKRVYMVAVSTIVIVFLSLIFQMLFLIIKDHKD
ncbi:chain-length determining protein [Neptunomonas phycophila]|uniref:chain-length determining protein n=1 Tax=Neptunomonas phycophila TaxID=1572645 RepID=UPI003735FD42